MFLKFITYVHTRSGLCKLGSRSKCQSTSLSQMNWQQKSGPYHMDIKRETTSVSSQLMHSTQPVESPHRSYMTFQTRSGNIPKQAPMFCQIIKEWVLQLIWNEVGDTYRKCLFRIRNTGCIYCNYFSLNVGLIQFRTENFCCFFHHSLSS